MACLFVVLFRLPLNDWVCFEFEIEHWSPTLFIWPAVVNGNHNVINEKQIGSSFYLHLWQVDYVAHAKVTRVIVRVREFYVAEADLRAF